MFDETCSALRDTILHFICSQATTEDSTLSDILAAEEIASISVQLVDDGLAVLVGEKTYSISIQRI